MQRNELYYHETRAICKTVHLPDFGGKPLDVMQMTALHEYVLDQGNKKTKTKCDIYKMNLFIYLMCQKSCSITFTSLEEGLQREDRTGN